MIVAFPVIGIVIGLIWAGAAYLLAFLGASRILTAAVLAILPYLLTGFIHLDGYMDCCDAILSRRDPEERHRILKDSHVGSFAVICIVLLMLMAFSFFASNSIDGREILLIFLPAASRSACSFAIFFFLPMTGSSYDGDFHEGIKSIHTWAAAGIMAACFIVPAVVFGVRGLSCTAAVAGALLAILYGRSQLGGMSGDISGFALTLGELCGVAVLMLAP